MSESHDVNDLHLLGRLPDDPFDGCEEIPTHEVDPTPPCYATTPDGRPYLVVPPGVASGFFIATADGGFAFVREKLARIELSRHFPTLETFVYPKDSDAPPRPMNPTDLFDVYGVRADAVYYSYAEKTRFAYRPPHAGDLYVRVINQAPPRAVKHTDVLEWMGLLFGAQKETMFDWLATAAKLDRPTGVPVLLGTNSLGKSMLPLGLARYFGEAITDYDDVFKERFNDALLRSPVVWLDEVSHGESKSGRFRKLAGNDRHAIEGKGTPSGTLIGCPRLIVTSNNPDPLQLGREDLTQSDEDAIGVRIILVDCQAEAGTWLAAKGGRDFTEEWVTRKDGTPGKLPETIAWLIRERKVKSGARFLVSGDATEWASRIGTRTGMPAAILDAITTYVEMDSTGRANFPDDPFRWDSSYPDHIIVSNQKLRACWALLLNERAPTHRKVADALGKLSQGDNDVRTLSTKERLRGYLVPKRLLNESTE